ncbi:hypothetical protein MNBD_GAMMA12-2614 [hydrothermal vent metagenome]|uniref:Uncharacterized protein n=1 Tax=hydrothermal vent metagenome TaxID=652676 RepID=A0A3B0YJT3_9ZZZZ
MTADTGYASEVNMKYLNENKINGYIPDNKFRQRNPKFKQQNENHGKRKPVTGKKKIIKKVTMNKIPSSDSDFDPVNKVCVCPAKE